MNRCELHKEIMCIKRAFAVRWEVSNHTLQNDKFTVGIGDIKVFVASPDDVITKLFHI